MVLSFCFFLFFRVFLYKCYLNCDEAEEGMRRVAARLRTQLSRMRTAQSNPLAEQTERSMIWQVFFVFFTGCCYVLFDASSWITAEVFWPVFQIECCHSQGLLNPPHCFRRHPKTGTGCMSWGCQGTIFCLRLLVQFLGLLLMGSKTLCHPQSCKLLSRDNAGAEASGGCGFQAIGHQWSSWNARPEAVGYRSEMLRSSRLGNARILVGVLEVWQTDPLKPLPCWWIQAIKL